MSTTQAGQDAPITLSPHRRGLIIAAMLASTFMSAVEVTVISTAMPSIVGALGGFDLFTWAFGIYLLSQAVMTPIYGRLADSYGRRRVYAGSVGVFLLGSLLCGCARSMEALVLFRALQGLGGGGLVPLATTIISDVSAPADRPRALGWISGIWGIAAIIGPMLGSFLVGTLGWPFVFWINLPIGVVAAALVLWLLRDPPPARGTAIDLPGAALLGVGIGAVMAVLVQRESFGPAGLVGLPLLGLLCLAGFALRERGSPAPILPLHLWRNPMILGGNVSALACGSVLIGATAFLPIWIEGVGGGTAFVAGTVLGVLTVSWTVASIGTSRVLHRLPYRPVALAGSACLIAGAAGLALLRPGAAPGWAAPACLLLGLGLGLHSLVFNVVVQTAVPGGDRGRATSLFFFCRLLGQALGAALFGGVLNAGLGAAGPAGRKAVRGLIEPARRALLPPDELHRLSSALAGGLHGVFLLVAALAVLSLLAVLLIPRRARLLVQ